MASGAKNHLCRICGGALQGNQRRWLFGGTNRRPSPTGDMPGTPTGSHPSRSSQSSPWGSTLSLGSSGFLSRSQQSLTSSSPAKSVDLLAVLTHILGQAVPRGDGHGEFVCGKCVCTLERVFKFDTVISRVKVLSAERLQKLAQERDQIRQWVRQSYRRRLPGGGRDGSSGNGDCEVEGEGAAYREMLQNNMALSEYECWSARWDTCPYFIRTGKRCRRGKGCEGCDSLRVPDSAYESVCGIPRHLPFQPFSPLNRDKSRSMPLPWQRAPSGPASLSGSTLSLQSVDSLDSQDPFELLGDRTLDFLLTELKGMEGNPLSSPSGSRIPILGRWGGRPAGRVGVPPSSSVSRTLSFREDRLDWVGRLDGEDVDVSTDLKDDFLPLHQETSPGPLHRAVRTLRGQLDRALDRVGTLETQLHQGRRNSCQDHGSEELLEEEGGQRDALLQILCSSLHSRELLIQECVVLIGTLSEEHGSSPELSDTLSHSLQLLQSQNKEALQAVSSETIQKELQTELEALKKVGRDRDRDLDTLNSVLRCNQDLIQDLREALQEKERLLEEVQQEKELWRRRGGALAAALQEKVEVLKEQLEERASGGGACWEEQIGDSATLCQEVCRLTDSLQEYQQLVQVQRQSHAALLSRWTNELQEARRAQREEQRRRREEQRQQEELQEERRNLEEALRSRDTLIQEILQDAERRDFLFTELQKTKPQPLTAIKHTL